MARMMVHPFDTGASASNDTPDQLMITWGNIPHGSTATIYWPAVASSDVITLANSLYGAHRLSALDVHSIEFPSGDMTLVPVPQGQGRLAGLLGIELADSAPADETYVVAVRQLTGATATVEPPPPPPPQPQVVSGSGGGRTRVRATQRAEAPARQTFAWHQVAGAFQYTLSPSSGNDALVSDMRLVAWVKWRIGVTPVSNRWLPVLRRYLLSLEASVASRGVNPVSILPSQTGEIPSMRPIGSRPPVIPPCKPPSQPSREFTGKVEAVHYDRFGDFVGFTLVGEEGFERRFWARESAVAELVRAAWIDRTLIRVRVDQHERDRPADISLLQ
jgi:hypothetical protein